MLNAAIISAIEDFAPASFQESWDNTGLQVGSLRAECTGVLLCVDVTPAIVDEARDRGCSLIVSHHPLIFKGLKRLTGNTPVEEAVMRAISYGISIYSCHTAVDSTPGGVSYRMAAMLGAEPVRVLQPLTDRLVSLRVTVKANALDKALTAFSQSDVACSVTDTRTCFNADVTDDPFGSAKTLSVNSSVIEAVTDKSVATGLCSEITEVTGSGLLSLSVTKDSRSYTSVGLGVIALLSDGLTARSLVDKVKTVFNSPVARCTPLPDDDITIRRIAMCGGSGSEFISDAVRAGAQAFITSDTRYHDFVDWQNDILIIDIGHFESESCTKEIFYNVIREKFPNFACYCSEVEENPIIYI